MTVEQFARKAQRAHRPWPESLRHIVVNTNWTISHPEMLQDHLAAHYYATRPYRAPEADAGLSNTITPQ